MVGKHNATGNIGMLGHTEYGVYGIAVSPADWGMRGLHQATANYGAVGTSTEGVFGTHAASGNYGQLGTSDSGVVGSGNVYGVYGNSPQFAGRFVSPGNGGNGGTGVSAAATAATGGIAVLAETSSSNGVGVSALHIPSGNIGQLSVSNAGVNGIAANTGYGVRGVSTANSTSASAVIGENTATGAKGMLGTRNIFAFCGVLGTAGNGGVGGYFSVTGAGTVSPGYFARPGNGPLVYFDRDDILIGSITVSGDVVSYNAFTGSHYARCDQALHFGELVRMTGENARLGDEGEVIYGVTPTPHANDPQCVGAYMGVEHPERKVGDANPLLIMAVGNGDMWVAQSSTGDIQPGDYLISSDVPGCAMKDDPSRFSVGHIVARAAESIDWTAIESPADGSPKRARISVFFTNFDRHGDAGLADAVLRQHQREIQAQRGRIDELQREIESLKKLIDSRR